MRGDIDLLLGDKQRLHILCEKRERLREGHEKVSQEMLEMRSVLDWMTNNNRETCQVSSLQQIHLYWESMKRALLSAPLSTPAFDKLSEILGELDLENNETAKACRTNLLRELCATESSQFNSQTTLAVALIMPDSNDPLLKRAIVYGVGDSRVGLLRHNQSTMNWHPVYESDPSKYINSYVSSREGIVGKPFLASLMLYAGDTVILSTDGANVRWTTPSGVPGVPFKKVLHEGLTEKASEKENLAERWLSFLKSRLGELDDDASIIIAHLLDGEATDGDKSTHNP
jgi:serine/threonine protein phosphatase PrpC